jgi:hypothetical protein
MRRVTRQKTRMQKYRAHALGKILEFMQQAGQASSGFKAARIKPTTGTTDWCYGHVKPTTRPLPPTLETRKNNPPTDCSEGGLPAVL